VQVADCEDLSGIPAGNRQDDGLIAGGEHQSVIGDGALSCRCDILDPTVFFLTVDGQGTGRGQGPDPFSKKYSFQHSEPGCSSFSSETSPENKDPASTIRNQIVLTDQGHVGIRHDLFDRGRLTMATPPR
jgi:hypothetical protein